MNPRDAHARGLADGMMVRAWNDLGEVQLQLKVTDAVRASVVYTPKGTWLATSGTNQTSNALISADIRTDIADGACYNDTCVEVAAA